MAQPVWLTPAGSLGTIPEGVFYATPLLAEEPIISLPPTAVGSNGTTVTVTFSAQPSIPYEVGTTVIMSGFVPSSFNGTFTVISATVSSVTFISSALGPVTTIGNIANTPDPIYFEVIAGQLPPGVQCEANGLIVGIPQAVASVQGVPLPVSQDITSKFAVRAYTTKTINGATIINRLADRTFSLTVTGQDAPQFITPAGTVGTYYDGSLVTGLQIEYTDTDPADIVVIKLVAGQLPPGITISARGVISGFVQPVGDIDAVAGYSRDGQGYEEYPFDFSTRSEDQTYEFVLEVTDGKTSNLRTFNIVVYSRSGLTADNTSITADNTFITADVSPVRTPIIVTPQGNIGTTRNDNFFAFQFIGLDLDGDQFSYVIDVPPPGLVLDPKTGWLYGYIPDLGQVEFTYTFSIRVYKDNDPLVISDAYFYSLSIIGTADTTVIWTVPDDLGNIDNGSVSMFYVQAVSAYPAQIFYRLASGSNSSLPQGLSLLPSGEIAGRVSFDTFALDGGSTTFDVGSRSGPTTFDLTFTFTVNAYTNDGVISVFKTFTIHVVRAYNEPYNNLYVEAMPPFGDRDLINSLLDNRSIIPLNFVYRPDDANFGIAENVIYQHAFGLTAATQEQYVSSLYLNHYWKNLVLGSIETAQALDENNNVIYEVVYSKIIDNLLNDQGQSVSKEVLLPFPITTDSVTDVRSVYPNSLTDMRDQVIDVVGQISNVLPLWMLSKQIDGRILGFTPAWVICYTVPGKSNQIKYNIQQQFGTQLNLVDFKVDRYELDRELSVNWDPITKTWLPASETTFDINNHYELDSIATAGTGYNVGDQILISGNNLDGLSPLNDVILTVNTVNSITGAIQSVFCQGTAPFGTVGDTYIGVSGTNISGSGVSATWDFVVVPGVETVFDGNSLKFITPVDMYSRTNAYDKYLVFPKRNILE
jgi:hypothetical protein